jgi:hypothetical protein
MAAGAEDEIEVWDVQYSTDYIIRAATLFWHYKFFVFDENKVKKGVAGKEQLTEPYRLC